jgi:UDP-3-O-[3-hydroxymyristoyl] glucosamine N-acyltransferase
MRLSEMARHAGSTVVHDAEFESMGFVVHETPERLVFIDEEKWIAPLLARTDITCVLTTPGLASRFEGRGVAVADQPRVAFYRLHNYLARETAFYGGDFANEIHPAAKIHPRATIAQRGVRIAANVLIESDATIFGPTIIGEGSIVRAGARIAVQGFEFKRAGDEILAVEHAGGVMLGARVEVQANSTIDRSIFGGFTRLGDDTKIDDHVHVAHNVVTGKRCLIAANAMLAGSVTLADDVWIGPSASVSSGLTIGEKASVTIGAVVTRNVAPGQRVSGNFAIDHDRLIEFLKTIR